VQTHRDALKAGRHEEVFTALRDRLEAPELPDAQAPLRVEDSRRQWDLPAHLKP